MLHGNIIEIKSYTYKNSSLYHIKKSLNNTYFSCKTCLVSLLEIKQERTLSQNCWQNVKNKYDQKCLWTSSLLFIYTQKIQYDLQRMNNHYMPSHDYFFPLIHNLWNTFKYDRFGVLYLLSQGLMKCTEVTDCLGLVGGVRFL